MDPNHPDDGIPPRSSSSNVSAGQPQQHQQQHHEPDPAAATTLSATAPALSPVSSRRSMHPTTPAAASETAEDYFPAAERAPSRATSVRSNRSRLSGVSASRIPTSDSTYSGHQRPSIANQGGRQPSIRIRRNSSSARAPFPDAVTPAEAAALASGQESSSRRPRSISQPERSSATGDVSTSLPRRPRRTQQQIALPRLTEEGARPTLDELGVDPATAAATSPLSPSASMPEREDIDEAGEFESSPRPSGETDGRRGGRLRRMLWPGSRRQSVQHDPNLPPAPTRNDEYDSHLVDWLDIVDPEVQTLSTLTNIQNSLFVPDLGNWLNRRPTYTLSQPEGDKPLPATPEDKVPSAAEVGGPTVPEQTEPLAPVEEVPEESEAPPMQRTNTISSRLTDSHYAALPHGTSLEGWTAEEKMELDDHVRHMLHSSRSKFKRRMKGFGQYVRRPLGFFVTLYATLITLFGLAWVLFLIGWIYVGSRQEYTIFVIDSVLVALFAVMGDGLAPFRAVDTYRLIFIWRYTRIIENYKKGKRRSKLQKKKVPLEVRRSMELDAAWRASSGAAGGPQEPGVLGSSHQRDHPDAQVIAPGVVGVDYQPQQTALPDEQDDAQDLEEAKTTESLDWEVCSALTATQQRRLSHHQKKLARSHSFYKPHETFTHNPFPLGYLIAIVLLCDAHSCLQISLGACTWAIDYHTRPFALTTTILCVSITCNITAGIVIMVGDRKTRKKDVIELLNRQELTGDAIKHIKKKKREESGDLEVERLESGNVSKTASGSEDMSRFSTNLDEKGSASTGQL